MSQPYTCALTHCSTQGPSDADQVERAVGEACQNEGVGEGESRAEVEGYHDELTDAYA